MGILSVMIRETAVVRVRYERVEQLDALEERWRCFAAALAADPVTLARDAVFETDASGIDCADARHRNAQRLGIVYFILTMHSPRQSLRILKTKIAAPDGLVGYRLMPLPERKLIEIVRHGPLPQAVPPDHAPLQKVAASSRS
jgi:hypothetical protein